MELAPFGEQNYQLELQAYQIAFPHFKFEPFSFVLVEIGTNGRTPTTPFVVQHVTITKLINPLRGGIGLELIPLLVQIFFILI
jgi:hypothetical protein